MPTCIMIRLEKILTKAKGALAPFNFVVQFSVLSSKMEYNL